MNETKTKTRSVNILTDSALMVALSFVLSSMELIPMPMGGSVTFASMLPIMLLSVKYSTRVGLSAGFVYSLTQLAQSLAKGNVFIYCYTPTSVIICVLFDYIIPFTLLGMAGIFYHKRVFKNSDTAVYVGITTAVLARFICHFITGVVIWKQWAPEGMGKFLYSFLYNSSYLSIDFIICIIAAVVILRKKEIRRLIDIEY